MRVEHLPLCNQYYADDQYEARDTSTTATSHLLQSTSKCRELVGLLFERASLDQSSPGYALRKAV
jgi:hypothetical protein